MLIPFDRIVKQYGKPKGILHLGANIGEEAESYKKQGVKNVIWVEANPVIYQKLFDNVFKLGHQAFNFCVGDENKETVLHVANNDSQSSSVLELGTHKKQHPSVYYTHDINVSMKRIDSVFSSEHLGGIDFVNLDLQGFEMQALIGMGELLDQFKYVYLEVNKADVYKGCAQFNEIEKFLNARGFRHVETAKWIGDWSDAFFTKK